LRQFPGEISTFSVTKKIDNDNVERKAGCLSERK
jgi:hypothetical protein